MIILDMHGFLRHKEKLKQQERLGINIINFHANINGMFYGKRRKIVLDNIIKSLIEIVGQAKKYKVEVMLENDLYQKD